MKITFKTNPFIVIISIFIILFSLIIILTSFFIPSVYEKIGEWVRFLVGTFRYKKGQ